MEDVQEPCLSDIIHTHPVADVTVKHFSSFERRLMHLFDFSFNHVTVHGLIAEICNILLLPNMQSIIHMADYYTSAITFGIFSFFFSFAFFKIVFFFQKKEI